MRNLVLFILLFVAGNAAAQDYYMGLVVDDDEYAQVPQKAELLTRDYTVLPSKYSLKKYCPKARSQSRYGTCTSWATTYAALTIAEAVKNNWSDRNYITSHALSPLFVYAQIKLTANDDCQNGTRIPDALELLKTKGAPLYSSFDVLCAERVSPSLFSEASNHKIDDYFTLFNSWCLDDNEKIKKVKKALSEDCPVVVSMVVYNSFCDAKNFWNGLLDDKRGNHAMCLVGYDDNVNGGSFLIMNSWGDDWGSDGFTWVTYKDFCRTANWAFELYLKKNPTPKPEPKPQPEPVKVLNDLGGSVELQLATGEKMSATLCKSDNANYYKIADNFISGTRYRIYISNNEPAYVYVIGSDLKNNVSKVFPPADNISAALTYKSNHIAIPSEKYYIEMDNTVGTDYMCVLYSKQSLPINDIVKKIKNGEGSFYAKVSNALAGMLIPSTQIQYGNTLIKFNAKSENVVVPIFVQLSHK